MAVLDEMGRWKRDAPGCKAAATHEYMWLGRPQVACVLHMEAAVEMAKQIGYREVEETLKALPDEYKPASDGTMCTLLPVLKHERIEGDVEDYWGE